PPGAILTSSTNVSISAEINANLAVAATGTSPTIQWQRSTNGGATWFDMPGATVANFTTPNLQLAESVARFRAVVTTPCSGASAPSAVAFITLTNPIVTPVSLIMDDHFVDPDLGFNSRNNLPLSVTNSTWYTDVDESNPSVPGLYAFNEPGD